MHPGAYMTLDERIEALEALARKLQPHSVPGTQLVRQLNPSGYGVRWSLALGPMLDVKCEFTGATVEEVLSRAETEFAELVEMLR